MTVPEDFFATPRELLESDKLSHEESIEALKAWRLNLVQLSTASNENMQGGENSSAKMLQKVDMALDELNSKDPC
jgi:hypothetical protein